MGRAAGAPAEIDLSWFDWTLLSDLSDDGRLVLFSETGEGGGAGYSTYLRGMDGSPALRIGEGGGFELSPDGKSVLALLGPPAKREIVIYPTGPGETRRISTGSLQARGLRWLAMDEAFSWAAGRTTVLRASFSSILRAERIAPCRRRVIGQSRMAPATASA